MPVDSIKRSISNVAKMPHFRKDLLLLVVLIPLILLSLFLLPNPVKEQLILHKDAPQPLTFFTAHFIHKNVPHLLGNVILYIILVIPIYLLNSQAGQRRKFYLAAILFFIPLPLLASSFHFLMFTNPNYGFSGIVAAFLGFLPYSILSYFKKSYNWKAGIAPFLNIILFFSFGFILLSYFEPTPYNLIILIIVWGLFFRLFIMALRDTSLKACLSSLKHALKKKRLIRIIPIIYLVGLVLLFPENIRIGKDIVAIHVHYIGFAVGFYVSYLFIREEFKRRKKK